MDASIAWVPPTRAAAVSVCAVAQRRLSPGVDCGSLLHGGAGAWHPKFVGALFLLFLRNRYPSFLLFLFSGEKEGGRRGPAWPVVRELGDAALPRRAERREWRRHRRPHRLHGWLRHQATALWRRRPPHRPAWERLGRIIPMAEGSAVSRAPFECVCGFTAGTSFAWEKHLALRNTPYSSVKHSRVIRSGGGDQAARRGPAASDFDEPLSSPHAEEAWSSNAVNSSMQSRPTPKALFHDRPSTAAPDTSYRSPSSYARQPLSSPTSASRAATTGMRLQEAAKRGDMDRVARLAVEILRLAQKGDPDGVLDIISDRTFSPSASRDPEFGRKPPARDIKFAANINALHQTSSGFAIEQVRGCGV